jgi:hypothetical protein
MQRLQRVVCGLQAAALVDATAVCAAKKSIEASLSLSPYATLFA